jgi:hypothetical protein
MATPKWYANGLLNLSNGGLDLDVASGYKLMLVTSSYSPTQATDNFRDDIGANEASGGTGYTAGGFTLASLALNLASLTLSWDAADISQAIVGGPFAFRYGVYYRARGGASSADELVGYVDFGAQSVTDATINITQTNQLTITAS